jgi:hypothetical protein
MKKKLAIILILVIVAATLFGGIAYAAERRPPTREKRSPGIGKVVDVQDDYILDTLRNGTEIKLFLDEHTRLHFHDGSIASFEDVQSGMWVGSSAIRISCDNWLAREILLFPSGYEPPENAVHFRGRVIELELEEGGFTIKSQNGSIVFVKINADTWFLGQVQSLDDIEVGMIANIHGYETEQGTITAHTLCVKYTSFRVGGLINGIDRMENTLTLEKRNGDLEEIYVDEETMFRSRDESIQSLSDLSEGMAALVRAVRLEDVVPLAKNIIAFDPDQLPEFDVRVLGEVISVSLDAITVRTGSGDLLNIIVMEGTRFRSRGGAIRGIRDINLGIRVGVGGTISEDDELLAEAIMVILNRP